MINIECSPENQDAVIRLVEQALKGVEANITEVSEEITELDVLQYLSYNMKQSRLYIGRIEGRTREIRGELKTLREELKPFFEICQLVLGYMEDNHEGISLGLESLSNKKVPDLQ